MKRIQTVISLVGEAGDGLLTSLINTTATPITALLSGSETAFNTQIDLLQADIQGMAFLDPIVLKLQSLLNSLFDSLSTLLFWPDPTKSYATQGQADINAIFAGFSGINSAINQLTSTANQISALPGLPPDVQVTIPSINIASQAPADMQPLVNIFLSGVVPTKTKFACDISQTLLPMLGASTGMMAQIFNLLFPYDG